MVRIVIHAGHLFADPFQFLAPALELGEFGVQFSDAICVSRIQLHRDGFGYVLHFGGRELSRLVCQTLFTDRGQLIRYSLGSLFVESHVGLVRVQPVSGTRQGNDLNSIQESIPRIVANDDSGSFLSDFASHGRIEIHPLDFTPLHRSDLRNRFFVPCGLVDESFGSAFALRDMWTAHGQHPCCPLTTLSDLSSTGSIGHTITNNLPTDFSEEAKSLCIGKPTGSKRQVNRQSK